MKHRRQPFRSPFLPPRYPVLRGALLTLFVSGGWLILYVINETGRITPTGLLLAILVGAPVAVWQYRSVIERRSSTSLKPSAVPYVDDQSMQRATDTEPASPVCYAGQADDAYMGYATSTELVEALNRLIEAERAGARVAIAWRHDPAFRFAGDFLSTLRADEARWCALLSEHVRRLGGTPSGKTGSFHARALAISETRDRLLFLNKGQSWVTRTLDALTPRIRDMRLHADLKRMRDAHVVNIAAAEALTGHQDQPPPRA